MNAVIPPATVPLRPYVVTLLIRATEPMEAVQILLDLGVKESEIVIVKGLGE